MVNLIEKIQRNNPDIHLSGISSAINFLESINFFEPDPPEPSNSLSEQHYKPTIAVLLLTTACNFRCIYCYASTGDSKVGNLSYELGCQAINIVFQNALDLNERQFSLNFHGGGEPTLNKKTFMKLVAFARSKPLPCRINLTTNGFWSETYRNWILDHVDEISLSFDGLPQIQNRQRPLCSGKPTYQVLMETIRQLDKRSFSYGIRMTVTDESIGLLPPNMKFLCSESACRTFQVEPSFNHGRAYQRKLELKDHERFAHAFLEAHDLAKSEGRHVYYSGARPWVITDRFCQAPEKALIVGADGILTSCYEVFGQNHELSMRFVYGKLFKNGNMTLLPGKRKDLLSKIQERRNLCKNCFCFWHCAGDCPSKTITRQDKGHLLFGPRCELNRMITKELILRNICIKHQDELIQSCQTGNQISTRRKV